jgi:hypothetical protein
LNAAYRDLLAQLRLHAGDGLAAAIYTQTTDVEIEVNGVMTYDRAVTKLDADSIAANRRMFDAPPRIVHVEPASDRQGRTWRFTTTAPPDGWFQPAFDDTGWRTGTSGFGAAATRFANVGTEWRTSDIWLRRTVTIPASVKAPWLRVFHDDDTKVYVNGVLAADLPGANAGFAYVALSAPARQALKTGENTLAIYTHQSRGGQFIDAGIVEILDAPRTPASRRPAPASR